MLLLDRDIRALLRTTLDADPQPPYIAYADATCVTNIGYDLRADCFMRDGRPADSCTLAPGESVFVSSMEEVWLGNDMVGHVVLKNGRIRMGLTMDAPVYQPGHRTMIYFRLTNISQDEILLEKGEKYTTLMIENLGREPDQPYDGTFQREFSFKGMADYKSQYIAQIQSLGDKVQDIKSLEKSVYGNVISILTIFVAIFTILNVNIELTKQAVSSWQFLLYNVVTLGALGFLAALMNIVMGRSKGKFDYLWVVPILCLILSGLILFLAP